MMQPLEDAARRRPPAFLLLISAALTAGMLAGGGRTAAPASAQLHGKRMVLCELVAEDENHFTRVRRPRIRAGLDARGSAATATISVNYTNFTAQQQAAFQAAVDIWSTQISSNVPIVIDAAMEPLGSGVLGSAGTTQIVRDFGGGSVASTWYPIALANKLSGSDLYSGPDIDVSLSSNFTWYYGTDGLTPSGQYDFLSVVLHELGHGLGFYGLASGAGSTGTNTYAGFPGIYDHFTEDGNATPIMSFTSPSAALRAALISNNVYWNGTNGLSQNGGAKPQLYAPTTWRSGSSYSHLNDATYPAGNANSLMTHALGAAEAIHNPGPIVRGIFQDQGWGAVGTGPTVGPSSGMTLDYSSFKFTATNSGGTLTNVTPAQTATVTFSGAGAGWTAVSNRSWLIVTSGGGAGNGRFSVSVVNASGVPSTGNVTGTVTVAASGFTSRTIAVTFSLIAPSAAAVPFGTIDTPAANAVVTGSIGVTGWAMDDIGVQNVKIYRNCLSIDNPASCQTVNGTSVVYIGDAAFLAGARPDVEALYPSNPLAYRAGWGYLMLTNLLPHVTAPTNRAGGGQGPLTIYAYATDMEGNRVLLGQKAITLNNDSGDRPFGVIDTPSQGGTVSGTFPNFGWALTPGSARIPVDGSTMNVVIDGVAVGQVSYDQCRLGPTNKPPAGTCADDVATLFPGHTNITGGSGAIGSFDINTTTLANGLHTIAWGVIDDQNRNDGIGSRFFTVLNGSATTPAAVASLMNAPASVIGKTSELAWRQVSDGEILTRYGFDFDGAWELMRADASGMRHATIAELGRFEMWPKEPMSAGYLKVNDTLRPLPPGSRLDAETGQFTWAPGPGYIGSYDLVFLQGDTQIPVRVTIRANSTLASVDTRGLMQGSIDLPARNADTSGSFTVAGWAFDRGAWQGSGVGAVHVWAQRRDVVAAEPVFLGVADLHGLRPDVGRAYGAQFDRSGWGLNAIAPERGLYDITAYFWSTRTQQFEDARTVSVTVR